MSEFQFSNLVTSVTVQKVPDLGFWRNTAFFDKFSNCVTKITKVKATGVVPLPSKIITVSRKDPVKSIVNN